MDMITIANDALKVQDKKKRIRNFILNAEEALKRVPGTVVGHEADESVAPLKHTFVPGAYIREIFMTKGLLLTSKIHKVEHPYFIMKGKVTVLTEEGEVTIKAPYHGITPAGTKRLLYVHEDTVWITVHSTESTDLDEIEKEIILPTFEHLEVKDEHIQIP